MSVCAEQVESQTDVIAGKPGVKAGRTTMVAWLARCRGWISIAILAPAIVFTAASPVPFRTDTWSYFLVECVGWLLFLAGGGLRWWSMLYIGGRKSWGLMTDGPYSITRNPIYLGTFSLALAVGVLSQSPVFLLALLFVATGYFTLTVKAEEQVLLAIHGDRFREYCARVPRFLPDLRLLRSPASVEVAVQGMKSELIRACRWVWIPLLCDLVTRLRCESWWPIWFRLW